MERLDFRRKKNEFHYESMEAWIRRYSRISGLIADSVVTKFRKL